jgi:GNAT superfamily N-acetyltransferase
VADRFTVRDVKSSDLDVCARLLAERHQRDRQRTALLPDAFEDEARCVELLGTLQAEPLAYGAVAEVQGEVVAFIFGQRALHAADHWLAQYFPPRSIGIPFHGHAASPSTDTATAYRALYGNLSDRWVAGGFFNHRVDFLAADDEQREVWFRLGFGAVTTYAGRDVSPIPAGALGEGIEVRRATPEDHVEVDRLESVNGRFHNAGPVFWPYLWDDVRESASGLSKYALERDRHGIFLATRGTETLGMQMLFSGMAFGSAVATPERAAYLFHGVVDPDLRGGGVGSALVTESLDWARESGHDYITLHYASMNPLGGPFWESRGFEAITYSAERRIDERVAWARPRD